jgi:predicted site-specific integrase-resolvase
VEAVVNTKSAKSIPKTKTSLLTLFDVALTLGISIATARRYALNGLLPSVRIAGRIRVPRAAVAKAQREGVGGQKT